MLHTEMHVRQAACHVLDQLGIHTVRFLLQTLTLVLSTVSTIAKLGTLSAAMDS